MPTPDEMKILKIIDGEGGESTVGRIARKMRLDTSYVRVILNSMGLNDLIDVFRTGKVRITIIWTRLIRTMTVSLNVLFVVQFLISRQRRANSSRLVLPKLDNVLRRKEHFE